MTTEKRSICQVCRGGLTFHLYPATEVSPALIVWAHNDKVLEETAGHAAVPDPAQIETVEV